MQSGQEYQPLPLGYQPPLPHGGPQPVTPLGPPTGGQLPLTRRSGWRIWGIILGLNLGGSFFGVLIGGDGGTAIDFVLGISSFAIIVWWTYTMYSEFNAFHGKLHEPILAACVPFFNIYAFYNYCEKLNLAASHRGRNDFINPLLTCCLIFILNIGLAMFQEKLNEYWQLVAAQDGQQWPQST